MFITIKNLEKSYGSPENKTFVLKGIDCTIEKGMICSLLGPSGSGKSTLLNIMGGIDLAERGEIMIDGLHLEKMSQKELAEYRRKKVGFIFQFYNLIPNLTIRENIESGAYLSNQPLNIAEIIHILGLEEQQNKFPNQVSGGQQQRAGIGRALIKLDVIFTEVFWRGTEVVSRHRKGAARPRRGLLKQQRHVFSLMNPVWHAGIFQPLIFTRRIQ